MFPLASVLRAQHEILLRRPSGDAQRREHTGEERQESREGSMTHVRRCGGVKEFPAAAVPEKGAITGSPASSMNSRCFSSRILSRSSSNVCRRATRFVLTWDLYANHSQMGKGRMVFMWDSLLRRSINKVRRDAWVTSSRPVYGLYVLTPPFALRERGYPVPVLPHGHILSITLQGRQPRNVQTHIPTVLAKNGHGYLSAPPNRNLNLPEPRMHTGPYNHPSIRFSYVHLSSILSHFSAGVRHKGRPGARDLA
ncbi:hypothetical protein C8Q77DRAFT_461098 [Trametes polyzona]|nr:hypothetical protein C8Q77DRAFT_461098 [Trametes polyzona]